MNRNARKMLIAWLGLAGLGCASTSAAGIAEHAGSVDPVAEAVSSTNSTTWGKVGAALGEAYAGPPAARDVTVPQRDTNNNYLYCTYTPDDTEELDARTDGWKLDLDVRVNHTNGVDYSAYAEYPYQYPDGAVTTKGRYTLIFSSSGAGSNLPTLHVNSTTANAFTPATDGFHLYELVFNPTSGTVSLFVDHSASPVANVGPLDRVYWGASNAIAEGSADYARVRLETLPEPASLSLLGFSGLLLLRRRRQQGAETRPVLEDE